VTYVQFLTLFRGFQNVSAEFSVAKAIWNNKRWNS